MCFTKNKGVNWWPDPTGQPVLDPFNIYKVLLGLEGITEFLTHDGLGMDMTWPKPFGFCPYGSQLETIILTKQEQQVQKSSYFFKDKKWKLIIATLTWTRNL